MEGRMKLTNRIRLYFSITLVLTVFLVGTSQAQEDMAKQSQNPLGTIISSPIESNFFFGIGPSDSTAYVLNWKPVYPVGLGDWNLINRLIVPAIYSGGQDKDLLLDSTIYSENVAIIDLATGSALGLGDITYTAYLSPKESGSLIWGIGGALTMPTATEDRWSSDKWSAGPALVALTMPGNWVTGFLIQNVWSFAGESDAADVNKFVFQYFVNYNLENGWYLSTTPVITANWEAESEDKWTVPFGGGVGKLVRHGKLPVDYKLAGYWNAEKPDQAPDWNLQFTVKFLFPK
jgi:hypothetical protein